MSALTTMRIKGWAYLVIAPLLAVVWDEREAGGIVLAIALIYLVTSDVIAAVRERAA